MKFFRLLALFSATLLMLVILNITLISAADWDNVKSYNSETKEIIITNSFGLGADLVKIKLTNNTYFCGKDCYAAGSTVLYVDGYLIDSIYFNHKEGKDKWKEKPIKDYKIYIQDGTKDKVVNDYSKTCKVTLGNGSGQDCTYNIIGSHIEQIPKWKKYNNEELLPGTYYWRIEGKKEIWETIDWIATWQGIEVDEWALWTTLGANTFVDDYNRANQVVGTEGNLSTTAGILYINDSTLYFNQTSSAEYNSTGALVNFSHEEFEVRIKIESSTPTGDDAGHQLIIAEELVNHIHIISINRTNIFLSQDGILTGTDRFTIVPNTFYNVSLKFNWTRNSTEWFVDNVGIGNLTYKNNDSGVSINTRMGQVRYGNGATTRNISIDHIQWGTGFTTSISSTLNIPIDNADILTNKGQIFNATVSVEELNITNATIFIWNSSLDLINETTNVITGNVPNESIWNITFPIQDTYEWNVLGCGNRSGVGTQCSFADSNNTFIVSPFAENANIFNITSFETERETYIINISTEEAGLSLSGNLNYNGTLFVANVTQEATNTFILKREMDIPLVNAGESQNKSFQWEITTFDGTLSTKQNSSIQLQNVSRIHLENCTSGQTTISLNFTAFDEQNLTRITPYQLDGTFDFWLGKGTIKRNSTTTNSSTPEVNLCINPNQTMQVNAQIEYDEIPAETNYTIRNYFFQNSSVSNETQDIPLYLLKSISSTSFILKVQDDNLLPLKDHLIFIQRFYPGENLFRTVQIAQTDGRGKSVGFFETETVDYRFVIKFNDEVLLITIPQKIVGESIPFTLTFTIGADLGTPWADLEDLPFLTQVLFFNKSTNIVTFTYTDTSNNFTRGRLVVELQNLSSPMNLTVCNEESLQASATIVCDVGNLTVNKTGTYTARGLITRTGIGEVVVSIKNFVIETFSSVAGLLGVFLAWFLIVIASFAFKFNEIAGIFMINATIIFVNLIGLVSFGMLAISAIIAVSIIIVAVLER